MRIEAVAMHGFPPFADTTHSFQIHEQTNGNDREDPPEARVVELTGNLIRFPRDEDAPGELHLLTGENGTGKTRLLCLLAAACGNADSLDARGLCPMGTNQIVVADHSDYRSVWMRTRGKAARTARLDPSDRELLTICREGELRHQSHWNSSLIAAVEEAMAALAIGGVAIAGESAVGRLQSLELAPEQSLSFEVAQHDSHVICQGMANLKIAASLEQSRDKAGSPRATAMLGKLEAAVSKATGREFQIDLTPPPAAELHVIWGKVPMKIGQLPDGLRRIIAWLVSCVTRLDAQFPEHPDPLSLPLVMLVDEPENHLHPAWQRRILPAAQALFPQAQMFVATHSPFVISSANRGWIHVFKADEVGAVTVEKPIRCSEGDTYLDVVEDILGVNEWYDPETERMLDEFYERRDAFQAGSGDYERVEESARRIAARSESLKEMMGREMRQVDNHESKRGQA